MSNDEYMKALYAVFERAMTVWTIARSNCLLVIEESLDREKIANRDIFEYGMQFIVDGVDYGIDISFIDRILSNIIKQEKDERQIILKTIQKEAVLSIQKGDNPRILFCIMKSYTDIPLDDPVFKKILGDDSDESDE